MSSGQSELDDYGIAVPQSTINTNEGQSDCRPKLGFETPPSAPSLADDVAAARSADWIVFTGRYPYVFDAARLGFSIGHREDSSYQWTPDEVRLPIHFLDNNYQDADLERFVKRALKFEPEIAVLGDIYNEDDLQSYLDAADEIWESFPEMELMLVPKCSGVLEDIPSEFVLGYANGSSQIQAIDVASRRKWRSIENRLHILGGTPLSTYEEIVALTKEWVTGESPANIAGLDWNGYQRYAEEHGDYASAAGGWHRNLRDQYLPARDLIRYSLLNAKHFWISKGIWPNVDVDDLPTRSELLGANQSGPVPLNAQSDRRELVLSPPPSNRRHETPIYRTDSTQAEIIEPLSPLASVLNAAEWSPSGVFSKSVRYQTPKAHHVELTCTGCGAHILAEPKECTGVQNTYRQDGEILEPPTFQIVSYEHQTESQSNDYESVPQQGPSTLESRKRFPQIHAYCSDTCRQRTERQTPRLLLSADSTSKGSEDSYPDGELIAELTLTTK
ncbi:MULTISPECIES: DUF6610 family protein [unclassified Haloarcula]|uniref:DUF6610 family protein n=1 Tax=Haloarcula sp. K1 TaxID=1622207 RepID=UPI0007BAE5A2|nr:DUF6610 family protein [Haloarcula sp. K1]KZX46203.1 hypothetical protein AV929_15635 [Haloarcula sp. K1]